MTEWGIDTLFNPGKRHMDEEKRRLQSTREEIGDSSGGKRIDLDGGVVRISRKPAGEAGEAETDAAGTDGTETDDVTMDESDAEPAVEATAPAASSAAERARARRLG